MKPIRNFIHHEAAGGMLLIGAAAIALLLANSPLAGAYHALFAIEVEVRVGEFMVLKPLLLWINDGLMAVFFFAIGLELKREILEGELSTRRQSPCPLFAAVGGMLVPALDYSLVELERRHGDAGLGDSGGHRHRICARRACCCSETRSPPR